MTTAIDYALLAGASYFDTRKEINRFPIPQGWADLLRHDGQPSGFEAAAFRNGNDIVISYAGTYPGDISGDIMADIWLGTGVGSLQLFQAAQYYLAIKNDPQYQGCNITFTGHSLGGGLAALVGVFFGVPATTFDQAPFKNSAQDPSLVTSGNPLNLIAPNVAANLRADLLTSGYTPDQLNGLTNFLQNRQTNGGIPNSDLITSIRVDGEFLSTWFPIDMFDTIGSIPTGVLKHAPTSVIGSDLHSQSLLTAMLQSGDTATSTVSDQTLGQVTFKLTDLLAMIYDEKLFAHPTDPNSPDVNLLEHLVRHQTGGVDGVQAGGDAMVTRFTADLWKLAQDGGLTLNDGNGQSYWNNISKALIAFAMQFYYEDTANATNANKQLFTDLSTANEGSNGIRFDITDTYSGTAATPSTEAKPGLLEQWQNGKMKLDAKDANGNYLLKGYQYFHTYIETTTLLTSEERTLVKSMLPQLRDWYIQAGNGGMTATDTLNNGAFMLGGNAQDILTGGSKADLLVGNAGDDILKGGDGSDVLIGGAGVDTYAWNASANAGIDTILDSDKQGYLRDDTNGAIVLTGGSQLGDNRVFSGKDANGANHIYTFVTGDRNSGGDLIVDGAMLIKDYNPSAGNHMGITLDGPVAAANLSKLTGNGSDNYIVNDVRNKNADPEKHATKYAEVDPSISGSGPVLEGGGGNDIIVGQGGDDFIYSDTQIDTVTAIAQGNQGGGGGQGDWLTGGSGNDTIVGSTGNDVLMGGGGSDLLIGGAGNDDIVGDTNWVATSFDWTVTDEPLYRLFQPAEGDSWPADSAADVIYAGEGNDHVWGDMGNDVIFGENGSDMLDGGDAANDSAWRVAA